MEARATAATLQPFESADTVHSEPYAGMTYSNMSCPSYPLPLLRWRCGRNPRACSVKGGRATELPTNYDIMGA